MEKNKEKELIEDALSGDNESFEQLLRPYRSGLLNTAYRMTGNEEDAGEICQEAIIKIYRHLRSFKTDRSFKSWIYKIMINTAYDFLKEKKRFEQVVREQPEAAAYREHNPEKHFLNTKIREIIYRCLPRLTPKERAVFSLRDGEGLSIKEAAVVLGCSGLSVRVHLSRARKKIRLEFEKIKNSEVNHEM